MSLLLPLSAVGQDPTTLVIYGAAVLGVIYIFVLRPMMRKKKEDPLDKPHSFGLSQQRAVERQMQSLLVEMAEMSRQITAQLDTRAKKLELLIDEADAKLEELKRLSASLPANARSAVERLEDKPTHMRLAVGDEDPRHSEVYGLSDQGKSAQEIAQQLNRPRGEVELILALRGR